MKKYCLPALLIFTLILSACGGGGSSSGSTTTTSASNSTSTVGAAQGVYQGTISQGSTSNYFEGVVLPDDRFYAIYGIQSGSTFYVSGMLTGQGSSSSSTYTVSSISDFYYSGTKYTGSLSGTFSNGNISGTVTETGLTMPFTGTTPPTANFNYNVAANLASVTGTWDGSSLDGTISSVVVQSNGSFAGGFSGCNYSGQLTPNASKNFFGVSVSFTGSSCLMNGQTATGVAVVTIPSPGHTQLLAAFNTPSYGTVFLSTR